MPSGIISNIANLQTSAAVTQPHYTLFLIVIMIFFILFSQRLFSVGNTNYDIFVTIFLLVTISVVIISTIFEVLNIDDKGGHIKRFNNIFNSPGSRNFLAVISFLMFVIFIYETPEYDNNLQHHITDKIFFGYNNYLSNRMVGVLLLMIFGMFTGYTIYSTTRGVPDIE